MIHAISPTRSTTSHHPQYLRLHLAARRPQTSLLIFLLALAWLLGATRIASATSLATRAAQTDEPENEDNRQEYAILSELLIDEDLPQADDRLSVLTRRVFLPLIAGGTQSLQAAASQTGQHFWVTKIADTLDGLCDSDCSLREAATAGAANDDSDTIHLPAGIYTLTLGEVQMGNDNLIGAGADTTIIEASKFAWGLRIRNRNGTALLLEGITVQHARTGIEIADSDYNPFNAVTISATVITKNGFNTFNAPCGGIQNFNSYLTLKKVVVTKNKGGWVGGVCANGATVKIQSSYFAENRCPWDTLGCPLNGAGALGGAYRLTVDKTTFKLNQGYYGGAIEVAGDALIRASSIYSNSAEFGGGIFADYQLTIENSTISSNRARSDGGGIHYRQINDGYRLQINYSTIVNNKADSDANGVGTGGGLAIATPDTTTSTLSNTILAKNTQGAQPHDCGPLPFAAPVTLISAGYNLIGNITGCNFVGQTSLDLVGVDPKLGSLKNNGGTRYTHKPNSGSPAINAANPSVCVAKDQRDIVRPQGGRCDIGAVEVAP